MFEHTIIPHLGVFTNNEPNSVVVVDNCQIHDDDFIALIRRSGAVVIFLPAYSPDLNPVELIFRSAKKWLKRNRNYVEAHPKAAVYNAIEDGADSSKFFFTSCGYM